MEEIRKKIIMVGDVTFYLLSIKNSIKEYYEVYTAQSAEKMFEILDNVVPDLILLDINKTLIDGYETIKKLKSDIAWSDIPVIFLPPKDDKTSISKGLMLGAVDFMTKPFSIPKLIDCIENQLDPAKREANRPIILAVDDNPSILKAVNHILRDRYKVYTLMEPEKIEELLNTIKPDLFLLDCRMPVLSGFDLVPIIRKLQPHKRTPIIFLTSETTATNVSAAMHYKANDFIAKPIDKMVLRQRIAANLIDLIIRRRILTLDGREEREG